MGRTIRPGTRLKKRSTAQPVEQRTARLTILIDPDKKRLFEEICLAQDLTPSQVVRRLIREYILQHAGSRPLPAWLTDAAGRGTPGQGERG